MASDGETWCANDPNFAVIYSFLKVFGKLYGLDVPTIAKLQEFIENTQEVSETLKELHLRLLRRALKTVHSNRWEKGMIKFCHQQGHHQEAWEIERFSYKKASTQVKLKVLKILLEFQFTCHPKFKTAVNAISCKELRLDPIGRDQNGCAYWLQVDDDANICLYKEDQDEETWQLIARNREEFVKVIKQLKSGEEISPSQTSNANEDSSGAENPVQESPSKPPSQPQIPHVEEDENEEEFLSPESESEQEIDADQKEQPPDPVDGNETNVESSDTLDRTDVKIESPDSLDNNKSTDDIENINQSNETITNTIESSTETQEESVTENQDDERETSPSICEKHAENIRETNKNISDIQSTGITESNENVSDKQSEGTNKCNDSDDTVTEKQNESISEVEKKQKEPETVREPVLETEISEESPKNSKETENSNDSESILEDEEDSHRNCINEESKQNDELSEAIEEPLMVVTGEGSGADCESFFIGEEISEPVMYFYGEGCGYDNDTGNLEAIEETNQAKSEGENGQEEVVNGEHEVIKIKSKLGKSVRLKTVNKRSLKKQCNDTNDSKPDTKKPCVRETDQAHNSKLENDLKREANVNDKSTTDSESPRKINVKKGRSKVKKKAISRKFKTNGKEAITSVSETDICQDKTSIIEKRKSSVSSVDQDDDPLENQIEKSPDKDLKLEDPLPTKKLRLESTPESDVNATHSKDTVSDSIENKDNSNHNSISKRKKIKASKGKFKRKSVVQNKEDLDKSSDIDKVNNSPKKGNKSLKRSLIEDHLSDKNKSESQSESEDDEPVTSGKRLKIKPKKIITSCRKKVEAKLLEEHSSDESEEETLYSLAGKKSTKKLVKKKPKSKSKDKKEKPKIKLEKPNSDDSDNTPVRQSRRIAQQKIKEEAERRHLEEVALRELKMIHKKKTNDDDEEEWRASGRSSSEPRETKRKHHRTWHASDSTEPDSESDSPLFELQPEPEPEHDYGKSDHEFSPESDLETDETIEPLKRARTLQEEKDDGFCKRCGSAEQPEWILLCDKCDAGYHASCLKPMLFVIPEGDWFCPPCNHDKLIEALESELVKYDELLAKVEEERVRKKLEEPERPPEEEEKRTKSEAESEGSSDSSWSSSSDSAGVYRLRARRQLPVSYRDQEYDRMISAAIKEEYVEPTTSAGNQGRGKDISTIIEAAEEEKLKAEREAIEQGKQIEPLKKLKKKQRRKPRKLNSLEVPSEDDDETDEDFKDTGAASSSEDISSSADKESTDSRSSDSLPIRRTGRPENKKDRPKMTESSPETKKKKKVFEDSSSESAGAKEWNSTSKPKSKSHSRPKKRDKHRKRDKSRKSKKSRGLTQYDAEGNVIRARVTYGGLSGDDGENDWSPKHRTRQKKINYTEMPNTESEDEMHKSSGKHMPDSSDEFKCSESDVDTDSESDRTKKRKEEEDLEREKALSDLVKKTAVVPLEKLPEDVTKAKTEELEAHLNAQQAIARPSRGKGSRGGRGSRGPRGRGGGGGSIGGGGRGGGRAASPQTDDALAKLVGVKIKELGQDGSPTKPNQLEREKKRQEREAKLAEKEAKKLERLQKKEEKEKLKEQKAKEREEKRLARIALQESKRIKKEKEYMGPGMGGYGVPVRAAEGEMPRMNNMNMNMFNHMRGPRPPGPGGPPPPGGLGDMPDQRFPHTPRLQVRAELRGVLGSEDRLLRPDAHNALREGTLSVAGSPQPFKPVSEEPSIITRMPHMINQQYRGQMMYPGGPGGPGGGAFAARQGMYGPGPGPGGGPAGGAGPGPGPAGGGGPYPHYYRLPPPPAYPAPPASPAHHHQLYRHHSQGGGAPQSAMHHNQGPSLHHSGGYYRAPPPGPQRAAGPPGGPGGSMVNPGPHPMSGPHPNAHNIRPQFVNRSPGPNPSPSSSGPPPMSAGPPGAPGNPGAPPGPGRAPVASPISAGPLNPGQEQDQPIKIKAEVKTEPEYRSPTASPGASSPTPAAASGPGAGPGAGGGAEGGGGGGAREEPPRHPKIKVTERRPRYPLGPYAPHLAPYRPYAPPAHHLQHPGGPPSHHPGGPPSHLGTGPPPHHPGTPPSHHPGGAPPHHPGGPPHHPGAPPHPHGPHPLQLRDPAQFMSERARSPAPGGGGGGEALRPLLQGARPYGPLRVAHHLQYPGGAPPRHLLPQPSPDKSLPLSPSPHDHSPSPHSHPHSPHGPSPLVPLSHGQPLHRQSPQGHPTHGLPPHGQPLHGPSPHGQPPHGQPPPRQPPHEQLPQGVPLHGQPPHGRPPLELHGQPPHGRPPLEQSPHGQPSHGQPPHRQQTQEQTSQGQSLHGQSHGLPPHVQSSQGQPPPHGPLALGRFPHAGTIASKLQSSRSVSPHGASPQGVPSHSIPPQHRSASPLGAPPHGAPHSRGSLPFPGAAGHPRSPPRAQGSPPPLHQPYAALPPRPRPAPRSPQSRSPPADRVTSPFPLYGERRVPAALPQPIPRTSLPPTSPRRRLESLDEPNAEVSEAADSPPPAAPLLDRIKVEREEGSVFGGLVSYFSSQHEDDMDG